MKGYIYKITNKKNGNFYIGSTTNIKKRTNAHLEQLKKGSHHCFHLQKAFEKYGKENFELTYKEITIDNEKSLRLLEERYINYCWNSGKLYNVSKKGCGGDLISYHPKNKEIRALQSKLSSERYSNLSEEEKHKRSENLRGEKNPNYNHRWTEEQKKRFSNIIKKYWQNHKHHNKGKTYEEIFGKEKANKLKKNLSEISKLRTGKKNSFFGKHHSEKTKKLLSEQKMGIKPANSKKVLFNGTIYDSAHDCANKLGINYLTVTYRCRNNIYGFSYFGENNNLPQKEAKKMWSFEECEKIASECKTIKELNEKYPKVLHHLRSNKDEYEKIKNKYFTYIRTYWNIDKVISLAKKYNSYKEFRENEINAYSYVTKHKLTNEIKKIYEISNETVGT